MEVRLDKWLWAARFFKTRALAAKAAAGSKIEINNQRAKPSRIVRSGDHLRIRRGPFEWTLIVKDTARLRGPAPQAQQLYEETEESARQRPAAAAQLKLERSPEFVSSGRPSKKVGAQLRGSSNEAGSRKRDQRTPVVNCNRGGWR